MGFNTVMELIIQEMCGQYLMGYVANLTRVIWPTILGIIRRFPEMGDPKIFPNVSFSIGPTEKQSFFGYPNFRKHPCISTISQYENLGMSENVYPMKKHHERKHFRNHKKYHYYNNYSKNHGNLTKIYHKNGMVVQYKNEQKL